MTETVTRVSAHELSIGSALPSANSRPTIRSTRSSTTAVASRFGRRGQDGSTGAASGAGSTAALGSGGG